MNKNGDDLVPAFGTKTSAAWFSSGTYPGDRGAVNQFQDLRGQVSTPYHPVVGVPVCLSVCACVVQCLVAVTSLLCYFRLSVCVRARARARVCVSLSLSCVCVCVCVCVRARAHDLHSDSVACQQDGVSLRIVCLSRRFRQCLYAYMTFMNSSSAQTSIGQPVPHHARRSLRS